MRVIALTGWSQEEARRATAASGFDSHLVKPVEFADLMTLLERIEKTPGSGHPPAATRH